MAAQESEACQKLATEVRDVLQEADSQWRTFEARLGEAEEQAIQKHSEDLRKWFGEEIADSLSDWTEGGLRRKTRDRIQKLLLAPIDERIRKKLPLSTLHHSSSSAVAEAEDSGAKLHPIDLLLEYWENVVEPKLLTAVQEDKKLAKKHRRLETVGAMRDAQREEQKRLDIWSSMRSLISEAEAPARELETILNSELVSDRVTQMIIVVPSIVARSICDWHFQRCVVEFQQLSAWWESVRSALQAKPKVWEKLLEEEGLFVRRIDRGIDEIDLQKGRYTALANFGHSGTISGRSQQEWPAESAAVLARVVTEMRRRLRPIRDSAAWRIIDSAKSIQKAVAEEEKSKEGSPWDQVGNDEGMLAICKCLGIAEPSVADVRRQANGTVALGHQDPADSALCFAGVIDHLTGVVTDLAKLVDDEVLPVTGGLSYILEEVLQEVSYVQEDLLAVMDDATEDNLCKWMQHSWQEWGRSAGNHLEAAMSAMPLKADSTLRFDKRQSRRSQLCLMRGLQRILADGQFRVRILDLAASPPSTSASQGVEKPASEEESCESMAASPTKNQFEAIALCEPPAQASIPASPRGGYVSRRPAKLNYEEVSPLPEKLQGPPAVAEAASAASKVAQEVEVAAVISPSASPPPETPSCPKHVITPSGPRKPSKPQTAEMDLAAEGPLVDEAPAPSLTSSRSPLQPASPQLQKTPQLSVRPVTPSFLDPPWPRQEVPFQSWSRPGTASTVCDEAELAQAPKVKFVDGQCIPMRVASSSKRLPPINLASPASARKLL